MATIPFQLPQLLQGQAYRMRQNPESGTLPNMPGAINPSPMQPQQIPFMGQGGGSTQQGMSTLQHLLYGNPAPAGQMFANAPDPMTGLSGFTNNNGGGLIPGMFNSAGLSNINFGPGSGGLLGQLRGLFGG